MLSLVCLYKSLYEYEKLFFIIDCSTCELEDSYIPSNGYGCFEFSNGDVACTCPDQRYTMNKPCRMIFIYSRKLQFFIRDKFF